MGSGFVMLLARFDVLRPSFGFKARLDRFFMISSGIGIDESISLLARLLPGLQLGSFDYGGRRQVGFRVS